MKLQKFLFVYSMLVIFAMSFCLNTGSKEPFILMAIIMVTAIILVFEFFSYVERNKFTLEDQDIKDSLSSKYNYPNRVRIAVLGTVLFILGTTELIYSFLAYGSTYHVLAVEICFVFGGILWGIALYGHTQKKLDLEILKRHTKEALNLKPALQKLIRVVHWLLIIFLACNLLGVSMFLFRLMIFYNHGGERLLAHLAAYDIVLWEQDGSSSIRTSDLGYGYFNTGNCRSPQGRWGIFQFTWNKLNVNRYRLSLQTETEDQEVIKLQPDLYSVNSKDKKTKDTTLVYNFFDEDGLFIWKSVKGSDVPPQLVQAFLAGLPSEEGEVSYSQRRDYYKSMVANDLVYFTNLIEYSHVAHGESSIFLIVVIIPKTALQWLWLHLFALLPGKALKYALPVWLAANILFLIIVAKSLAYRIKIMKKDADGSAKV